MRDPNLQVGFQLHQVKRNPESKAHRDPVLPGLEGRQSGMERSEMKRVWGVAAPN